VTAPDPIPAGALKALFARARRDIDDGTLPSCQVAVAHSGRLIAAETFGAEESARYVVFSVTKALTASAIWLLFGEGNLRPETAVAELVPEFATPGKDLVTVEHLLTHTAGFARAPMRPEEGADPDRRRARFASWRLDWAPGSRTEYHATSASWVLADLIERVTGTDFRKFFASRVAGRLGLPRLQLGVPADEQGDVLDLTLTGDGGSAGEKLGDRLAETADGLLLRFNEPRVRAAGVPGAGAVAGAGDVALYYQALLHDPSAVWDPAVLADATGRIRNAMVDPLLGVAANRTLGLVIAGDDGHAVVRQFGRTVGPRTFGSMGVGGQLAWADPDTGLSFCYLTNGLDVEVVSAFTRSAKIAGLAGRCGQPA